MDEDVDLWLLPNGIQALAANALRVMRGAGLDRQVITDIENIAHVTDRTRGNFNLRTQAADTLAKGLRDWRWDSEGLPKHREFSEIIDASLRIVTGEISGNGTEASKAESDMHAALRRWREGWQEQKIKEERLELEELAKEASRIEARDRRCKTQNDKMIGAANDNESCFVYFVTDGDAIKIGKANNPKARLSGLQTSHYKPLRILGLIPGSEPVERSLHLRFRKYRIRGEWFHDCAPIRRFIKDHAGSEVKQEAA